jgi:hypothetical protein
MAASSANYQFTFIKKELQPAQAFGKNKLVG